jgi:histidine ammonia-lyase
MFANLKFVGAFLVIVCIAIATMTDGASAVSVEVARKCNALTAKAFPPRVPGNPAAGRANGTAESARAYFNKCVANGGYVQHHAE